MSLTTGENESVILSKARQLVCLEAAWEMEALAYTLPNLVPNVDETHGVYHAVRGIAGRFVALSHVLMAAIGDEAETTAKLERRVMVIPISAGGEA